MLKKRHTYILQKLMIPLLAGLISIIGIHFSILYFHFNLSIHYAIADAVVTNVILGIVIASIVQFLTFYQRKRNNFFYAGLITSIESVIAGFIIIFILKSIHPEPEYLAFLKNTKLMRIILDMLICISLVKGILLAHKLDEFSEDSEREIKNKEILKEAELQKLQQQLQPHFLFNSLNSINALIISDPEEASVMVQKLSDFLRYTTKNSDGQFVKLREELEFLELYLDIEKVRFGHRLNIQKDISESCLDISVPTLILQPIVENAIKFGLYGTTGNVEISVKVICDDKNVIIEVKNPFDQEMAPQKGTGFGISGLKRRLYLLYARNDLLRTQAIDNLYTATIKIPVKK